MQGPHGPQEGYHCDIELCGTGVWLCLVLFKGHPNNWHWEAQAEKPFHYGTAVIHISCVQSTEITWMYPLTRSSDIRLPWLVSSRLQISINVCIPVHPWVTPWLSMPFSMPSLEDQTSCGVRADPGATLVLSRDSTTNACIVRKINAFRERGSMLLMITQNISSKIPIIIVRGAFKLLRRLHGPRISVWGLMIWGGGKKTKGKFVGPSVGKNWEVCWTMSYIRKGFRGKKIILQISPAHPHH